MKRGFYSNRYNIAEQMDACRKRVRECQINGFPLMAQANADAYQGLLEDLLKELGLKP